MYDPRIEAAAIAMYYDLPDVTPPYYMWDGDTERERERYRLDAQVALAAADKAATVTEPEQLAALPAGTRLESQVGPNFDYWNVHGDLLATCLNAAGYVGPVTEIKLPARVIHWGGSDV